MDELKKIKELFNKWNRARLKARVHLKAEVTGHTGADLNSRAQDAWLEFWRYLEKVCKEETADAMHEITDVHGRKIEPGDRVDLMIDVPHDNGKVVKVDECGYLHVKCNDGTRYYPWPEEVVIIRGGQDG